MNDNIINYLYRCQEIKDFCKKNKLSKEVVLSNFAQFSSYKDSVEACKKCDGKKCLSKTKNTKIELEYKNGKVVQKELPHHDRNFNDEQLEFINKWIGFRSFTDKKEKVRNKATFKVTKYNLKKIAA